MEAPIVHVCSSIKTKVEAKAWVDRFLAEAKAAGEPFSRAGAYEELAHRLGFKDWNTLSAKLVRST